LPEVDVVDADAAQGAVEGGQEGAAGGASAEGAFGAAGDGFGGEDEFVAGDDFVEEGAEEAFGFAFRVDVGGVDEGAAGVGEGHELGGGLVRVGVAAPRHRAQCGPGDAEAAAAEVSLFHVRDAKG